MITFIFFLFQVRISQDVNLLFMVDRTGEMQFALNHLESTIIPQVLDLIKLTTLFNKISILTYYNYSVSDVCNSCEWTLNSDILYSFINENKGNGEITFPAANKTGLIEAINLKEDDTRTLCIWYKGTSSNLFNKTPKKKAELGIKETVILNNQYNNQAQWSNIFERAGNDNMLIFPIHPKQTDYSSMKYLKYINKLGCNAFEINTDQISHLTMGIIYKVCGLEFELENSIYEILVPENYIIPRKYLKDNIDFNKSVRYRTPEINHDIFLQTKANFITDNYKIEDYFFNLFLEILMDSKRRNAFKYSKILNNFFIEVLKNCTIEEIITIKNLMKTLENDLITEKLDFLNKYLI